MLAKMRQSLFIRFLFSYIVVMLIPIISLYWLYTRETTAVMGDEIYNSVVLDQQYALSLLDNQVRDLYNTANQFQLTRGFRSYADSHSFYTSESGETYGEIIEDLFTLYQMNPFAKNLFIYFPDMDCAFSTNGLHEIHTFTRTNYQYQAYTSVEYLTLLKQVADPTVLKSQEITINGKTDDYVTFLFPLFENFGQVAATAVFCVESHLLTDMFSTRISKYNVSTYIRDEKGELVAAYHPLPGGPDPSLEKQNYFTISRTSPETGWSCTTLLPKRQPTVYKLMKYGRNFTVFSALTLLFSFLIVCYMMRLNYHPIRQLKDKATGIDGQTPHSGKTELETISYALDYLKEQNTRLNTTIIDQLTLIDNGKLRSLLNGEYASVMDFNNDCDSSLHYTFENFFAAIILFHKKESLTETTAQSISAVLEKYFESNYIYHLEPDKLITINAIPDNNRLVITDAFCSVLKSLNQSLGLSATVGIGNITKDTTAIGRSFMEAQAAVGYRFVKGKGTVILYSDICRDSDTVPPYPYEQFQRLNNALAARDKTAVSLQVNDILSYILTGNIPLFLARGICFDILRTIDEDKRSRGIRQPLLDVTILQQLSGSDTARDTVSIIQSILERQAEHSYSKSTSSGQLIAQVKVYIQKHCCSCDFSVQELSETFHMLPSNLSALFKSQTGGTILDYVTDLRMARAKKLLKDTDLNLNDISISVGYYNTSSFIRRFKKHQGVTPGAYRESMTC